MPRLTAPTKADPTTATGQAINRAQTMAKRAGKRPGTPPPPHDEPPVDGLDEFAPETTSNPQEAVDTAAEAKRQQVEAAFSGALTEEELDSLPQTEASAVDQEMSDGDHDTRASAKKAVARRRAPAKKAPAKKTAAAAPADTDDFFAPLTEEDDYLKVLWYGLEGSTKTTSLATAANECPEGSYILVINAEGGLKVKALKKHGVDTSKIRIFPNPQSDEVLNDASLEKIFLRVQADLIERPGSWFAVGIDSITEVGQLLTDEAQADRVARLRKRAQQGVEIDPNFVDRDDYGVSVKIIRKWVRRFRDLPCHLMITALQRRDVDEDTNQVMYGPACSPSAVNDLMGYVDIAIMLRAADDDKPIRGLTKEGGKFRVKDRFEVLPKVMVEPTFDRILDYFREDTTEEDDPFQASLPAPASKTPKGGDTVPE